MTKLCSLAVLGASLLAGCMNRGGGVETDTAESAIDSSDSAEAEGDMMMASVDGADVVGIVAATPDQVAARIAANLVARWNPRACATIAQSGATITATYTDCTGPRGLVHVSGQLVLVVSVSGAGAISVQGTSDDLQVNGASLVVDATALYSSSGTSHSLAVTTHGSGTGPRGLDIVHDGDYTLAWDTATQCHTLDGNWSTEIGAASRSTQASLHRCVGQCPSGTVTRKLRTGATLTVTFDGQGTATWSSTAGRSGTVTLACAR